MVVHVEVPPFVGVRVIGDLRGAPAICFQLDLVLLEIEEGEVGLGLPRPVQGVLPGGVTFWRRSCCGPQFVIGHALTTFLCCRSFLCDQVDQGPCPRCWARLPTAMGLILSGVGESCSCPMAQESGPLDTRLLSS